MNILVVEDKQALAGHLGRMLEFEGFSATLACDGESALEHALSNRFDIVLLDIMLPRISGLDVLRRMRAARIRTQTILLTARDSMKDIVDGLDAGADDYITKPFALDVLLARVRAAARRVPEKSMPVIQYMDLSLNPKTLEMQRGGRVETLTRTEYALLETLVQRAEHVVQRNVLIDEGWGQNSDVSFDSLYVFIRSLRKKITHAGEKQLLHTIRGVGYCLKGKP